MPDLYDLHDPRVVVYRIDDPVRALADSVALLLTGEFLAAVWTRSLGKTSDSGDDSSPDCARLDSVELLGSGRLDEDAIACHAAGEP
jgi:hypothetical protein